MEGYLHIEDLGLYSIVHIKNECAQCAIICTCFAQQFARISWSAQHSLKRSGMRSILRKKG